MSESIKMNQLVVRHQDGDLVYLLKNGGYCVVDGMFSVFVNCEAAGEDQYPSCAVIGSVRIPVSESVKPGMKFTVHGGMRATHEDGAESKPISAGYFGFHVERIVATWEIEAIDPTGGDDHVIALVRATHDDVDYYDERAERTPTEGRFRLGPKPRVEIWDPLTLL